MTHKVATKTDWNTLPASYVQKPAPNTPTNKKTVSVAILGTALAASAYYFLPSKLPRLLAIMAIAAAAWAVIRRSQPPIIPAAENPLQKRITAGAEIDKPAMTYTIFRDTFKPLLDDKILVPQDIVPLLERDIEVMDYDAFIKKHAGENLLYKLNLFQIVPPESKEILRIKCLAMSAPNPTFKPDQAEQELVGNAGVNADVQALVSKDWDAFRASGADALQVKEPHAAEALKILFLAKACKLEIGPAGLAFLPQEMHASIRNTMFIFELQLFADGILAYKDLKWQWTWADVVEVLPQIDASKQPEAKRKLAEALLARVSYNELVAEGFKIVRDALGVTDDIIESTRDPIRKDCMELPYLGENGFRNKHGNKPIKEGVLKEEHLDKIKQELREKLPSAVGITHYEDLELLGMVDEIYLLRWQKLPLQDIWKDKPTFLKYCEEHPAEAAELKPKIVQEIAGLSIFQLLLSYYELFQTILKPDDKFIGEKTFAEVAEESVKNVGELQKAVGQSRDHYGSVRSRYLIEFIPHLMKLGLLNNESPALRGVLEGFVAQYGQKILEEGRQSSYEDDLWKQLAAIPQIVTPAVLQVFNASHAEVKKAKEEHTKAVAACNQGYVDKEKYQKKKEESERLGVVRRNIQESERKSWPYDEKIRLKTVEVSKAQDLLLELQSILNSYPVLVEMLETQKRSLETETQPDAKPLIAFTEEVRALRKQVHLRQQKYDQELAAEPGSNERKAEIKGLKDELDKANEAAAPTRNRLFSISDQISKAHNAIAANNSLLYPQRSIYDLNPRQPTGEHKKRLEDEIAAQRAKIKELEEQNTQVFQNHQPFRLEWERLSKLMQEKEKEWKEYVAGLQISIDLKASVDVLEQKEQELRERNQTFESKASSVKALQRLNVQIIEMKQKIAEATNKIREQEALVQKTQQELDSLLDQQKQLKQEVSALLAEERRLNDSIRSDKLSPQAQAFFAEQNMKKEVLNNEYAQFLAPHLALLKNSLIPEVIQVSAESF